MKINNIVRKFTMWIALIIVILGFSIVAPNFRTGSNFMTILRQVSMLGIMSVGMTFVLISGGIDLSIGSLMSFVGVLTALLATQLKMSVGLSILLGIFFVALIGLLNGIIITKTKMPPLIATLAMLQVIQGLAYIICKGLPVYDIPSGFKVWGQGYVGFIPVPVIIMVVILCLGAFILNKTYFGRYLYALGSNDEASRLSGLKCDRIRILVYTISAILSGLAGIIMMSRVDSGQPKVGTGYEMDVLTACVVGGVSIAGGRGKISDVVVGVLLMGVLSNGLVIIGLNEYYQLLIKGLVLLFAVGFDYVQQRMNSRVKKIA